MPAIAIELTLMYLFIAGRYSVSHIDLQGGSCVDLAVSVGTTFKEVLVSPTTVHAKDRCPAFALYLHLLCNT